MADWADWANWADWAHETETRLFKKVLKSETFQKKSLKKRNHHWIRPDPILEMLAYLKRSRFYEFNWFTLTIFFRQTPRNNFHSESPRAPSWYTSPWGQRWRRRRRWGQTGCTGMHCCHLFPPVSLPLLVLAMLNYQLCSWKSGKIFHQDLSKNQSYR